MLKTLSTLLLIPTLAFALEESSVENNSPWNFDIQYDYVSLGDSYIDGSKKITTINLLLDSHLDENTTIHGDFYKKTTKSNYNRLIESSSVTEKGIREFYITSSVIPNTEITVGKKAFRIDNKKGVQDLGVRPLILNGSLFSTSECVTNQSTEFNKCVGIDSAYIKTRLSDNLEIELLKTIDKKPFQRDVKGYKTRLEYSTDTLNYYLTTEKNVQKTLPYSFLFYPNNSLNNKTSVELSLIEKKEMNSLNQWFAKVKHTKNNNNCPPNTLNNLAATNTNLAAGNLANFGRACGNLNYFPMFFPTYRDFLHSNSLALGKVFTIDNLLINAELSHNIATYNNYSYSYNYNYVCLSGVSYSCYTPYTADITKKKIKTNSLSLMLEYPIKNGKITSSHTFVRRPDKGMQFFGFFPNYDNVNTNLNSIDITHNFTKNVSGNLGYQRFDFIPSSNSTYTHNSITYSLKYKF